MQTEEKSDSELSNNKIFEFIKNNDSKILKSYSAHIQKYTESINVKNINFLRDVDYEYT